MMLKEKLVCPVCGKTFTENDDTKYLVRNEYTCSFACFKKHHVEHMKPIWERRRKEKEEADKEKELSGNQPKRRGRKKKVK